MPTTFQNGQVGRSPVFAHARDVLQCVRSDEARFSRTRGTPNSPLRGSNNGAPRARAKIRSSPSITSREQVPVRSPRGRGDTRPSAMISPSGPGGMHKGTPPSARLLGFAQKTQRAACGAPHRDWRSAAHVPRARSERGNHRAWPQLDPVQITGPGIKSVGLQI